MWVVVRPGREETDYVFAETWWVTDNGDLLFGEASTPTTQQGVVLLVPPVPSNGFAAGTWTEVFPRD